VSVFKLIAEVEIDAVWRAANTKRSLCRFGTRFVVELIQSQYLLPSFFRETITVKSAAAIAGMQQVG
jgi:hypothetical protein